MLISKIGIATSLSSLGISNKLCKVLFKNNVLKNQTATLTRAIYRDEDEVPLIKPYPYHEKAYEYEFLFTDRMHKHNKIIVVDGQIASGKDKLARELAKHFDFLYLPQPTFDDLYIGPWGFDFRSLDSKLPEPCRTWDIERFLQDPFSKNNASMQHDMFKLRTYQYRDVLLHSLCTGQGVVTVRSPWSDIAFLKAMCQNNYITKLAYKNIKEMYTHCLHRALKPHVIVYLDVPVDDTLENIKNRGEPFEKNAKALTEKYVSNVATNLKRDYLLELKPFCLQLVYDWSEGGDVEDVVDDIEALNFEDYVDSSDMLRDWRGPMFQNNSWQRYLKLFASGERGMHFGRLHFTDDLADCKELWMPAEAVDQLKQITLDIPDLKYAPGFNDLKGDTGYLTRNLTATYFKDDRVTPLIEKYKQRVAKLKAKG